MEWWKQIQNSSYFQSKQYVEYACKTKFFMKFSYVFERDPAAILVFIRGNI